jgi:hypothetical protein
MNDQLSNCLTISQTEQMLEDLLDTNKEYLPLFCECQPQIQNRKS